MTEAELIAEKARTEGARTTFEFLKHLMRYNIVFSQCQENSDALSAYLKEKNLDFTLANLVSAYNDLTARGHKFVLETLAPPAPIKKELPPLPEVPGMKDQHLFTTMDDIARMPRERWQRLANGPSGPQFRARRDEIIRRHNESVAKEERE